MRQFLSGLTNQRGDEWGTDRLRFARDRARRRCAPRVGADRVVGLRLSCDELAPWAGITPEMAPAIAADLVGVGVDYVVVVRGSIFSIEQTRPDFHQPTGFNVGLAASVAAAVDVPVVLQGSVVDVGQAEWAVGGYDDPASCAAVEMTRAQIADPDLVAKLRAGDARADPAVHPLQPDVPGPRRPQPARDVHRRADVGPGDRGPRLVRAGARAARRRRRRRRAGRAGGGPRRRRARATGSCSSSATDALGGLAAVAGPNGPLVDWLGAEVARLGVDVRTRHDDVARRARRVVQCTGRSAGVREYEVADGAVVVDVADVRRGTVDAARPTATSSCSTRSAGRSASPSPRSSAGGPCS